MDHPTYYVYDGTRLASVTDALEGETGYTYTTEGYLESVTDPLGRTTYYTYDEYGRRITMTDPADQTWSYVYDDLGRLTDTTDPQEHVTHNVYDNAGRLLSVTRNYDPNRDQNEDNQYNIVTEYQYDLAGNQIAVTDTYGLITRTYYDVTGRPATVVQNLTGQSVETATPPERGSGAIDENLRTDTVYDAGGNVIAMIDPKGVISRTYFDQANRPVHVIQNLVVLDGQGIPLTAEEAIAIVDPPAYNPAYPDRNIQTSTYYDDGGQVIATEDVDNKVTRTFYDALNRPVTVVQNLTAQDYTVATWDPQNCATSGDANLCMDTYYDANGNVIATKDSLGIITRTFYDALNRPTTVVQHLTAQDYTVTSWDQENCVTGGDANLCTDTYYDAAGQAIATVDPMGIVTRSYYDDDGRAATVVWNLVGQSIYVETLPTCGSGTSDENICATTTYDEVGRRVATTDPLGHVTKYEYNEGGQLESVTVNYLEGQAQNYQNQYNIVTEYTYDALGRQLTTTDTLGRVTTTTYDSLGRTASTTQNVAEGQGPNYQNQYNITTAFTYDRAGAQIAVTDPLGMITRTYYDAVGRAVSNVRNLSGQGIEAGTAPVRGGNETNLRVDTVYNGNGQASQTVDELGNSNAFDYDALGRQVSSSDPLEHSSTSSFDVAGRLITSTDAEGVVTRYGYDSLGRLTDVWENYKSGVSPDAETNVHTVYTYDANGNRLTILDGNEHETTFAYDALGRLESETDPLDQEWSYSYDVAGNRVAMLDANGATTAYTYDELNRLVLIDYPAPDHDVSFTYDAVGRRLTMADGLGTTTWTYDNLDRPLTTTDPFDNTVTYTYNALGNRVTLIYPDEKVVSYTYDSAHRLDEISLDSASITGYTYDATGQVTGVTRANGMETTYTYDDAGRVTQLVHSAGSNSLASYSYGYDNVGNRTSAEETYQQLDVNYLFGDGFEGGNLEAWSSAATGDGSLTASGQAALAGNYGLKATVADQEEVYVQDESPSAESSYGVRFYFDPHSILIPAGEHLGLFAGIDVSLGEAFSLRLRVAQNQYQLAVVALDDSQEETQTSWVPISNGPHAIEIAWQAAAASGAANGSVSLQIDGAEAGQIDGIDNDTYRIDTVRLGALAPSSTGIGGSIYFDAYRSRRTEGVGLDPAIPVPPASAQGQADDFESGDFSAWSGTVLDNGNLSVDTASALEGVYGMEATADGDAAMYSYDDSPYRETSYHNRFYFDPNSIDLADEESLTIFEGRDAAATVAFSVELKKSSGDYYVRVVAGDDSLQNAASSWSQISDAPHALELAWSTASSGGAGNGSLRWWIDDQEQGGLSALENGTRRIDEVRLGLLASTTQDVEGSLYFDDFVSARTGHIGLNPNIPTPDPLPGQIFADAFESGDLSAWDDTHTDGNELSVSAAAAMEGDYGLQGVIDDALDMYVLDGRPFGDSHYRARFYFDPNSAVIPTNQGFDIFVAQDTTSETAFRVHVRALYGEYELKFIGQADNEQSYASNWIPLSDEPHAIEVEWLVAGDPETNNGYLAFWVDGTERARVENLDNDTRRIDAVRLGVLSATTASISGTVYFDDFSSNRAGDYVGLNENIPVPGSLPDQIFSDAFETGDVSAWSGAATDGGDLSVTSSAAIEGSYGLSAVVDDQADIFVHDERPVEEPVYQARFYFDPNSVVIPENSSLTLLRGSGANGGGAFRIQLAMLGDDYAVRAVMVEDDQGLVESDWIPVSNQPHSLELEWWRAWSAEVSDGRMILWIDGRDGQMVLQDIDNDQKTVGAIELGAMDITSASIAGTIYLDDFDSRRSDTYIGLDPNVTLPSSDFIFADGFESGTLFAWSGAETDSGELSVTTSAALFDTYGLQAVVDDGSPLYAQDNSPLGEPHYRARFYFDPNSISIPDGESLVLLEGRSLTAGTVFQVSLRYSDDEYEVGASLVDDSQESYPTDWIPITDEPHALEIEWLGATEAESANGGLIFWVDGDEDGYIPWIDNDSLRLDNVRLGAVGLSSEDIAGTVYLDDFVSQRSEYIGPREQEEQRNSRPGGEGWGLDSTPTPAGTATFTAQPTRTATPTPPATSTATAAPTRTATPTIRSGDQGWENGQPEEKTMEPALGQGNAVLSGPTEGVERSIDYTYDPLYRLTAADYSSGDYYHYTYDAVGNRLSQASEWNNLPVSLTYTYDDANRLTGVGEVEYTWDDNGNLLSDGVNTYAYGTANHLMSVSGGSTTVGYLYNGLGDRLEQTVDSQTTGFVLDLNGGLSQVLSDGTNTYTYGLERLSQVSETDTEYFLGDALGSVRQLTDADGVVTLTQSYDPYGNVESSLGEAESIYGFDGEQTDYYIKLINLRSRMYFPSTGTFLTRDSWRGDDNRPLSFNRWNFVEGDPINLVDPSGFYGANEVHFSVTRRIVMDEYSHEGLNIISAGGFSIENLANLIGTWDENVDQSSFLNPVFCTPCHFMPLDRTIAHVNIATNLTEPYLFGASLHQMQDYFSHWYEGWHDQVLGHGETLFDPAIRTEKKLQEFYHYHEHDQIIRNILSRNPNMTIENLNKLDSDNPWNIIDLYLRGDNGVIPITLWQERAYYGFNTDLYAPFSDRELRMEGVTSIWADQFLSLLANQKCPNIDWALPRNDWTINWDFSKKIEIKNLLIQ